MVEYIEREAAQKIICGWCGVCKSPTVCDLMHCDDICPQFSQIPAADVRPVVKAKWEWNDNNGYYYCGNCKAVSPREDQDGEYIDCPNYCPNCGADMRPEPPKEGEL